MPKLNKPTKMIIYGLGLVVLGWGVNHFILHGSKKVAESQNITQGQLASSAEVTQGKTTDTKLELPKFNSPVGKGTQIQWWVMAWNSQFPLMYANGGIQTSQGSLFEKAGIDCKIIRQDDCGKTIAAFIDNANSIKKDPNTVPIIMSFMGDGMPGFSVMLKDLKKLGKEYEPIIFYFMGRSNGEDCFWGPAEWKKDPKLAKGHCVAGVERDGDLNIVLKWAADNNIPVNAQTKYYDRNAINIIPTSDFVEAGNKYITGFTEKRVLIRSGKTIPDSIIEVTCDAYTSWTPVDVTVAEKKGGLVRLASTAEYTSQMPNAAVVLKAWAYNHTTEMRAIVRALGMAGDQCRSFPEAQEFAAKVSAVVYGDNDKPGSYWLKYYRGIEEKDATGRRVFLGGSQSFNLADAANMCGKGKDGIDRYKVTYEYFGNTLAKLYPKEMEGWSKYSDIMDKSFIEYVLDNNDDLKNEATETDQQTYASSENGITNEVANKIYDIQFDLGKFTIRPESYKDLDEIYKSAVVSEGLTIGVYGHTDDIGNEESNRTLSENRAQAVADYLIQKGLKKSRIIVKGYGQTQPLSITNGNAHDPRNRAVEIVQGT